MIAAAAEQVVDVPAATPGPVVLLLVFGLIVLVGLTVLADMDVRDFEARETARRDLER